LPDASCHNKKLLDSSKHKEMSGFVMCRDSFFTALRNSKNSLFLVSKYFIVWCPDAFFTATEKSKIGDAYKYQLDKIDIEKLKRLKQSQYGILDYKILDEEENN